MRYDVFVTVWGKDFVEKFVEFSLGSQLAAGNLPALAEQASQRFRNGWRSTVSEKTYWKLDG